MFLRMFIITKHGYLDAYSGDKFNSPMEYMRWIKRNTIDVTVIAWAEDNKAGIGDRARYDACLAAIVDDRFNPDLGKITALKLLRTVGVKMGIIAGTEEEGEEEENIAAVPEKKEKPMLQIAQDFVESISEEELIRRTSEATKAICGGGKL